MISKMSKNNLKSKFQKIYDEKCKKIIRKSSKHYNLSCEPILYTEKAGKNRFRSGLAYLLGEENKKSAVIGAVGELIWATILIFDDIGDKELRRRGQKTAWKKFGILHSSHSAGIGLGLCINILKKNNLGNSVQTLIEAYCNTSEKQIEQSQFNSKTPLNKIVTNYKIKGSLGGWPLKEAIETNKNVSVKDKENYLKIIEISGVLGQLLNDLNDIFDRPEKKSSMNDIEQGVITVPIKLLLKILRKEEKGFFLKLLKNNEKIELENKRKIKIMFKNKKIKKEIKKFHKEYYGQALNRINKLSGSSKKTYIKNWIKNYYKLFNF